MISASSFPYFFQSQRSTPCIHPFGGAWNVVLEGMGKHPPNQKIPKRMQAADFLLHPTSQESGKCIELLVSFALEGFGNFHEDF